MCILKFFQIAYIYIYIYIYIYVIFETKIWHNKNNNNNLSYTKEREYWKSKELQTSDLSAYNVQTYYICYKQTYAKTQGVSKRALQLWKLIEIYTEDIHNVLNCQNVAKHTEFYLG